MILHETSKMVRFSMSPGALCTNESVYMYARQHILNVYIDT